MRLDPSWKNMNDGDPTMVGSRQWAVAYITRNYPGDVGIPNFPQGTMGSGCMARFGNDKYDGPDKWTERGNAKLQMQGGNQMLRGLGGIRSPSPASPANSPVYPAQYPRWNYNAWWQDFWFTKHSNAMVPAPAAPDAPAWPPSNPTAGGGGTPNVPNMLPFNPQQPSNGLLPRPFDLRDFNPNCGGTNARKGIACVEDPTVGGGPRIVERDPPRAKCCVPEPGSTPPFTCTDDTREACDEQGGTWDITLRCQGNTSCPAGGLPNTICYQDEAVSGGAPFPAPVLPDDFCPTQPWVMPAEGGFEHEGTITGDANCDQCHNEIRLCVDRPTAGNGEVDPRASNGVDLFNTEVPVLPDRLNTNDDDDFDYYDGPAEFDDLPSSIYHARSTSGLDYGGDMAFGEVTSTRNTSIYGEDIGSGNPALAAAAAIRLFLRPVRSRSIATERMVLTAATK
ncbi:MAG: hypothetical protein IPK83_08895 [Planctomycetes bacterium]|nr:hypothetical protein [Planctomycetota bacterium]